MLVPKVIIIFASAVLIFSKTVSATPAEELESRHPLAIDVYGDSYESESQLGEGPPYVSFKYESVASKSEEYVFVWVEDHRCNYGEVSALTQDFEIQVITESDVSIIEGLSSRSARAGIELVCAEGVTDSRIFRVIFGENVQWTRTPQYSDQDRPQSIRAFVTLFGNTIMANNKKFHEHIPVAVLEMEGYLYENRIHIQSLEQRAARWDESNSGSISMDMRFDIELHRE